MTLEEAKAVLAYIAEAERLVAWDKRMKEREWAKAECDAGRHDWITNNVRFPYCCRCGKEKR